MPTIYDEDKTFGEWVPLNKTFVDTYGRNLGPQKLLKLRRKFDLDAVGVIYVSLRNDGRYAVLDGHHRIAAAMAEGHKKLPARVYIDLTYEEEARLYTLFATTNMQTRMDMFRAKVEAHDPDATKIATCVRQQGLRFGWEASHASAPRVVHAIGSVEMIYEQHGEEILRETLRLLDISVGSHRLAFSSPLLHGMASFLRRYNPTVKESRLVRVLQSVGVDEFIAKAKTARRLKLSSGFGSGVYGEYLYTLYNHGLREDRKLPPWEKYAKSLTPVVHLPQATHREFTRRKGGK